MKRIIYLFLCSTCLLCLSTTSSYGQFLKKFKKTVKELVATPVQQNTSSAENDGNNTNSHTANRPNNSLKDPNEEVLSAPATHGIEQLATITLNIMDQYVCMAYTAIQVEDSKVVATIPIGNFIDKEALSEIGEGSDKDLVQIYKNDKKGQQLSLGDLRKQTALAAAHKQFDFPWGKELVRSGDKAAGDYIKKGGGPGGAFSSIVFHGKQYGPYMVIGDLLVSNDQSRFFTQISPDMQTAEKGSYSIMGMDGKPRALPTGGDLIANMDFSSAAILLPSTAILLNESLHSSSASKGEALQQQATQLMQTAPNKGNVYFLNGKTLEGVLLSDGWLDQSGQNFFATISDKNSGFEQGTYLNGQRIFDQGIKKSRGWTNKEGSSWAVEVDDYTQGLDQLIFSDGTKLYGVKDVHQLVIDGKYYMVWYIYNHKYSDQLRVFKKLL